MNIKALLTFCLFLATATTTWAEDGFLPSTAFPEDTLAASLELVNEKLEVYNSHPFATDTIDVINDLRHRSAFRLSSEIALIGNNGHDVDGTITGVTAVSIPGKNRAIYFRPEALDYDLKKFSRLLLHEILHLSIQGQIAGDEVFIEELAQAILAENVSKAQIFATKHGFCPKLGRIRMAHILDAIIRKENYSCPENTSQRSLCLKAIAHIMRTLKTDHVLPLHDGTPLVFIYSNIENQLIELEKLGLRAAKEKELNDRIALAFKDWLTELNIPTILTEFTAFQPLTDGKRRPDFFITLNDIFK